MNRLNINALIKTMTGPNSTQDLNRFINALPARVGTLVLAAGGIAWAIAGLAILYATLQSDRISKLRTELAGIESLTPPIPKIQNTAVERESITAFVKTISKEYERTGIKIEEKNGKIEISGNTGGQYGVFREAVGHIQNGGEGWRVSVDEMCVGRECATRQGGTGRSFLYGLFSVSRVTVEMPG